MSDKMEELSSTTYEELVHPSLDDEEYVFESLMNIIIDEEPSCPICKCCLDGQVDELESLLEGGEDPNGSCGEFGDPYCGLIYLSLQLSPSRPRYRKENRKMFKLLLRYGANYNFTLEKGELNETWMSWTHKNMRNIFSAAECIVRYQEDLKRLTEKYSRKNIKSASRK